MAQHYRSKGYQVHASMVLDGRSGSHRIPMLCEGPLGNLTVFFGDAGGIDEREIGSAKRIARDLGATAVVAAAHFTTDQRKAAADLGVVLLDEAMLGVAPDKPDAARKAWPAATTPHEALARDLEAHPWPDSGRPGGFDGPHRAVTYEVDELLARFDAKAPAASAASVPSAATPRGSTFTSTTPSANRPPTAQAAPAPASVPTVPPTTSPPAGLPWKHPRAGGDKTPAAAAQTPAQAGPAASGVRGPATRFAWLNLPKPAEAAPAAEYEETVATQATTGWDAGAGAAPATRSLGEKATAAPRVVDPLARARRRVWVRRAAWMAAGALFVYLFLLWWF